MATSPPPEQTSPSVPPRPRYRGFFGAIAYALAFTVIGLLLGLLAGFVLWLGSDATEPALQFASRAALLCAAAGIAVAVARLISGGESDRLLTLRFVKGEVAGLLGFLLALALVGFLSEPRAGPGNRASTGPARGRFDRAFIKTLGKQATPPPVNPLQRWFAGVMAAPWWLLLGCCVSAAALFALLEARMRRAFQRRASEKAC